jgi:hypothetical protein
LQICGFGATFLSKNADFSKHDFGYAIIEVLSSIGGLAIADKKKHVLPTSGNE